MRNGDLAGMRQRIESVNDTLKGQLDLRTAGVPQPASTPALPEKRRLIAYDH